MRILTAKEILFVRKETKVIQYLVAAEEKRVPL